MINQFWEESPWWGAMALCGLINAVVAYQKLYRDAKSPFFRPWRILGFYIWLLIEIALPAALFWFYGKLATKPPVNPELYLSAIAVGFFFTLFVNSNSDLGFVSFSIDKYYGFLNQLAYNRIGAAQTGKLTRFKRTLHDHLSQNSRAIDPALNYLKTYLESDISLKFDEKTRRENLQKIATALQQSDPSTKAYETVIIAHLVLRRRDYPDWLKSMNASHTLIDSIK